MVIFHQTAFAKGRMRLTKCGLILRDDDAEHRCRGFEPTCPECCERPRWPDRERQREFDRRA